MLVALGLHFLVILLYAMPINPVSVRLRGPISHYIEPLFYQNWQLFAPDPLDSERGLLLRVRVREGSNDIQTTDFFDITSPKIASLHATRLFPGLRNRIVSSILSTIHHRDPVLLRFDELGDNASQCYWHFENIDPTGETLSHECNGSPDVLFTAPIRELIRSFARAELRYLAPELLDVKASQMDTPPFVEAQLRMVHAAPIPFSRRNETPYIRQPTVIDSPWIPVLPQ